MKLARMHPEDVKAGLRKQFGSVAAFEHAKELPAKSVHDVLRGRPNKRVREAIEKALTTPRAKSSESDFSDSSDHQKLAHRINAEAR